MASMSIRAATTDDLAALTTLYQAFHVFHVERLPDRLRTPAEGQAADVRSALMSLLAAQDAALFVAEAAGTVIGLVEVYLREDAPDPATVAHRYGYVQSLMVTAGKRANGAGTALMEAAGHWANEHEASELRLNTWELADGPLAFYERLGYQTLRRTLVQRFPV